MDPLASPKKMEIPKESGDIMEFHLGVLTRVKPYGLIAPCLEVKACGRNKYL